MSSWRRGCAKSCDAGDFFAYKNPGHGLKAKKVPMKLLLCAGLAAICATAAPAFAAGSNVGNNNTDVFTNRVHPFDNPAAAAEAARAIPGVPYVDPVAGQTLTRPALEPMMSAPHPFDSPAARREWQEAIPGAPVIDPAAARDISRPNVNPYLDQPFPYDMAAPPQWDTPPLPGQRGYRAP